MQHFHLEKKPFPAAIHGKIPGVIMESGGRYLIIIDSTNTEETQTAALRHELAHLALNHLEQTKPLYQIDSIDNSMFGEGWTNREQAADRYAEAMTEEEFADLMAWEI